MRQTALIVVLSTLRHQEKIPCKLFAAHIVRQIAQLLPYGGKQSDIIAEDLAVGHLCQILFRDAKPFHIGGKCILASEPRRKELIHAEYAVTVSADRTDF